MGKDEYWIVEVPKPGSFDVVYVIGCPMSGENENERYQVPEIRLAK